MKENLIGKSKEEVVKLLTENKSNFRIVSENGVSYMVTCDFIMDRFNLSLEYDLVTDVTMG